MNVGRMVLAGLVSGVIIFGAEASLWGGVLADARRVAEASLGSVARPAWGIPLAFCSTLLLGVMLSWLSIVLRASFGNGLGTALRAGGFLWLSVWLTFHLWNTPSGRGLALLDPPLTLLALGWSLLGVLFAALAARWVYGSQGG